MKPVKPFAEPLSQVVFVEDYLQLVFQGERLSVFSRAVISKAAADIQQGEPGFCDALVQLIGQHAESIPATEPFVFAIAFEAGATLHVYGDGSGPEAFQLQGESGVIIVGRDA